MSKPRRSSRIKLATLLMVCMVAVAWCCDTPVYRFAMYNWAPSPYEVYHFYVDQMPADEQAVDAELRKLSEADDARVNLAVIPLDLKNDLDLSKTPILPEVRAAWLKDNKTPTSGYLIVGPRGAVLHRGSLKPDQIPGLIHSKQRTQLARQLEEGHACVFLVLPGKDDKQTEAANKEVARVMADIDSGKISLYEGPAEEPATPLKGLEGEAAKGQESAETPAGKSPTEKPKDPPKTKVSMMVVDRQSPQEAWFVNNLLSLEDDLKDLSEPMVFPVYGRARALLPMVGKGIHYNNLVAAVEFVTGACSCEIKDENPGVDLLVHYDWETAAGKIADKFGREEGNENRFSGSDLFPEILIPSGPAGDATADATADNSANNQPKNVNAGKPDTVTNPDGAGDSTGDSTSATKASGSAEAASTNTGNTGATETAGDGETQAPEKATPTTEKSGSSKEESKADRQVASNALSSSESTPKATQEQAGISGVMIIGTGVGLALLFLMVATLVIMRPR